MKLFCLGLNHRTATIETRERFTGHPGTRGFLRGACRELLLLTTCNRVEIYAAAAATLMPEEAARALASVPVPADELGCFYLHEGAECARHLFRVTAGLDSMVVGETEILGQAKRAYAEAARTGDIGPVLHRLVQRAFRTAKAVRSRTELTRGAVSVGSVAVDLAEKIFGDLRGLSVLVLGAGETSEKTLRALSARGVSDLRVSNRTPARAEELAAVLSGIAVPFSSWTEQCREIDILVASTSAESHLLTAEALAPMLRERIDRPLLLLDLAVPRNIAPEVNELDGVYLYDIDSLRTIAAESLESRRRQFAAAEEIIDEHVCHFVQRSSELFEMNEGQPGAMIVPATLRISQL